MSLKLKTAQEKGPAWTDGQTGGDRLGAAGAPVAAGFRLQASGFKG